VNCRRRFRRSVEFQRNVTGDAVKLESHARLDEPVIANVPGKPNLMFSVVAGIWERFN
jgi:hypothetical protein